MWHLRRKAKTWFDFIFHNKVELYNLRFVWSPHICDKEIMWKSLKGRNSSRNEHISVTFLPWCWRAIWFFFFFLPLQFQWDFSAKIFLIFCCAIASDTIPYIQTCENENWIDDSHSFSSTLLSPKGRKRRKKKLDCAIKRKTWSRLTRFHQC